MGVVISTLLRVLSTPSSSLSPTCASLSLISQKEIYHFHSLLPENSKKALNSQNVFLKRSRQRGGFQHHGGDSQEDAADEEGEGGVRRREEDVEARPRSHPRETPEGDRRSPEGAQQGVEEGRQGRRGPRSARVPRRHRRTGEDHLGPKDPSPQGRAQATTGFHRQVGGWEG